MSFLYPGFLYALSAITIPIIIHLFNFRRYKTLYFSDIRFIKDLKSETRSRSTLKQLLILLMRIFAITSLVLAFAQPYIPAKNQTQEIENHSIIVYLDNSFSMQSDTKYGKAIEVAKSKAIEIVNAYNDSEKFFYITNNFKTKHLKLSEKEHIVDFIQETEISANTKKTSQVITRIKDFFSQQNQIKNQKTIFYISDIQKTTTDFDQLKNDTNYSIKIIPIVINQTNNLIVDSCWFDSPYRIYNQTENMFVKIRNISQQHFSNIPLKLLINDTIKSLASFNIKPNSEEIVELNYTNTQKGLIKGEIIITDYPITYDNNLFFSYKIAHKIKVLIINNDNTNFYLGSLFDEENYFNVNNKNLSNLQINNVNKYNVIVLNELKNISSGIADELKKYVESGGTLVFLPSLNGNINDYNKLLKGFSRNTIIKKDTSKIQVTKVNTLHPIYKNVFKKYSDNSDLPQLNNYYTFTKNTFVKDEILLQTANKQTILSYSKNGNGNFYVFASPINKIAGNFYTHPLIVPTFYNILNLSQMNTFPYHIIGKKNSITVPVQIEKTNNSVTVKSLETEFEFIPLIVQKDINKEITIIFNDEIKNAGNYIIKNQNQVINIISFNYNRIESDITCYTINELQDQLSSLEENSIEIFDFENNLLANEIKKSNKGMILWKFFLILALIFLAFEIIIIKIEKKNIAVLTKN